MKTILFLVPRSDKASTRYRVLQYVSDLEKAGYTPELVALSKTRHNWISLYRRLASAEIVVVQKVLLSSLKLKLVKLAAKKLVYDFDDAVMFKDGPSTPGQDRRQRKRFLAMLQSADRVIAGNEYLASQAAGSECVAVIPTVVDLSRYPGRVEALKETVSLGWIGSRSTLKYLQQLTPVFNQLADRRQDVQLKVVSDDFPDLNKMTVVKKSWSEADEIADLASFDIGLMPLVDDPWTRGKCGFKLLQYMAMGIPVVCSPVGANCQIVADGVEGFWANNHEEWLEKIELLLNDRELRLSMGAAGRKKIAAHYSLATISPRFIAAVTGLSG